MTARLSPDPPILTLPPPSQAVWVNGEPRNGEEILLVTPPSYTPTIGGLLTDPSTIPNPRLCCPPSNQGIQAYVGSRCHTSHLPAPQPGYIHTSQWVLKWPFQHFNGSSFPLLAMQNDRGEKVWHQIFKNTPIQNRSPPFPINISYSMFLFDNIFWKLSLQSLVIMKGFGKNYETF